MTFLSRAAPLVRALRRDIKGTSLLEFALAMPVMLTLGGYGAETANLALINMRVSHAALQMADNASRIGVNTGVSVYQLREGDLNDVLQGARLDGDAIDLTTNGRVTVSSLENIKQSYDSAPVQRIHWQRCIGIKSGTGYDSTYGTTPTSAGSTANVADAGTTTTAGMGDTGAKVNAPSGSGVIFVEVNYLYRPLFGTMFMTPRTIHYIASFIVRDRRDYAQIFNPSPTATASTCNLHAA
jgi:hypothetical protein